MLRCPHCGELLSRSRVGGIELDGCRACGGVFFDAGELDPRQRASPIAGGGEGLRPHATRHRSQGDACVPEVPGAHGAARRDLPPGDSVRRVQAVQRDWLNSGQARAIAQRRGAAVPAPRSPSDAQTVPPTASASEPRHPNRALAIAVVTMAAVLFTSTRSVRALSRARPGHGGACGSRRPRHRWVWAQWRLSELERLEGGRPVPGRRPHRHNEETVSFFDIFLKSGDSVAVLYPSDDPRGGRLGTFSGLWFVPLLFLIVGGILTVGAYLGKAKVVFERLPTGWDW